MNHPAGEFQQRSAGRICYTEIAFKADCKRESSAYFRRRVSEHRAACARLHAWAAAALLIGDPALRLAIACAPGASRNSSGDLVAPGSLAGLNGSGSVHIYDIVENWFGLTRLPAVLAVWAARREAVTPELVQDFQ